MPAAASTAPSAAPSSSLAARFINMLVSPGEVFDEVAAAPPRIANCLAPILLVILASLFLQAFTARDIIPAATATGAELAEWKRVSEIITCAGAIAGTFCCAAFLWFVSNVLLGSRVAYWKAVELVALTSIITALGALVTALLIAVSGDPAVRPDLALLVRESPNAARARAFLNSINLFHLWSIAVLALGLSRLSRVSFKESAFWVFGYWLLVRLGVVLLG